MNSKTKNIVSTGLMAAVIAVVSVWQIPLPFGVPMTFQIFAVALSGYVLGWGRGSLAVFIYTAIGASGVPVFCGFMGGVSVLFGSAGGFIAGFLPLAFLSGLGMSKKTLSALLFGFLGLCICHLLGVFHYAFVMKSSLFASFFAVSLPYILKDAALIAGAYFLSLPIKRRMGLLR